MPADRDDLSYIWDMLDASRSVMTHVAGMKFEQYVDDRRTRMAVERN